ncbi:MAG: biotin synthase BioB [Phycisphaerae bacterium]|nr:biotin synthase BioB [Phycisphaerae bacterium]
MKSQMDDIGRRVQAGKPLRRPDILAVLAEVQQQGPWKLLNLANRLRREKFGDTVRLCSIVPGKLGNCSENCKWCAQSTPSAPGVTALGRTSCGEISQAAVAARQLGASRIGVVNSGLSPSARDLDDVIAAAQAISETPGNSIGICASLGELTDKQARRLADSTIVRYHHNLETSRRFFPNVVTSHTYDGKLRTLKAAKEAGLGICCGGLFGVGESWDDRIDLALTLRDEVQPDSVPLNFLVPVPGTPLESAEPLEPMEILTIIALYRLILPDVDIRIAGGRESNLRGLQSWIFYAGASGCMIGNYLTTAGQTPQADLQMLKDLNLEVIGCKHP